MCCSALAAITKCHRLGELQQQTRISHSSGSWKSKIKVPADSVSGEGPSPSSQSGCVLKWQTASLLGSHHLLTRAPIPSGGPGLTTSSNPNHFPKAPPPNTIALGVSTCEFGARGRVVAGGGGCHIQTTALSHILSPTVFMLHGRAGGFRQRPRYLHTRNICSLVLRTRGLQSPDPGRHCSSPRLLRQPGLPPGETNPPPPACFT